MKYIDAEILALQEYPDEKPHWGDKFWISHKREREEYVKQLLRGDKNHDKRTKDTGGRNV